MKKQFYILITVLLSCFTAYAQETGSIEGKILSIDGYPLSGISIKIGKKVSIAKTDTKGIFKFENFPIGLHTITIEGEGLKKQTKEIIISEIEKVVKEKKEKAIEYAKKRLHCKHPREQRSYIGNNLLICNVCGLEFS